MITLIWAQSSNGVIGRNNGLPWTLPGDLKHFKNTTSGYPIIMGRKTWESIGRPLPGRRNIVVSNTLSENELPQSVTVVRSVEAAIELLKNELQAFVIGGGEIYRQALPMADCLIVTHVHGQIEGDTYAPDVDWDAWIERRHIVPTQDGSHPFSIHTYRPRRFS